MGKRLHKLVSVSIKWSFNFASILISLGFRNWTDATKWNNLVSSLILFIENISPFLIVSSPIAKSPQPHTVTIFGSRCRTYPIDGMLLLDLHNSSHLSQTHSITVKYLKYLWLKKVLNKRGKLWTCFRHVKAESRKITHIDHVERTLHYSRYMHYYFQSGELISLILPINCECGQL